MRSEEIQTTITLSNEVMESSVNELPSRGGRFVNVGGYGVQAAHRQRFQRNAVPAQRDIGWCRSAAAEFAGVAIRLPGLNCIHCAPEISERTRASVAQTVQTLFIDDLDGSAAEGTVRFGLDGAEYEIDLNASHAQELRDALARYLSAARRVGGAARRPARGARRGSANGLNSTKVRDWAQGIEVKDRGRVPAELVVKFKAATGQ
jgi:Lsr2